MSLLDLVQQHLGQNEIQQISQQIGADPSQTQNAVHAAIPMLLGGMAGAARTPGGAQALSGAMQQAQGLGGMGGGGGLGGILGSVLGGGGAPAGGGMGGMLGGLLGGLGGGAGAAGGLGGMLGALLGGHQDDVQGGVQQASGLSGDQTKKLLLLLAPIVLAAIAHQRGQRQQQSALPGAAGGMGMPGMGGMGGLGGAQDPRTVDSDGDGIPDYLEQEARHAQVQAEQRQPAIGGLLGKILGAAQRPPRA